MPIGHSRWTCASVISIDVFVGCLGAAAAPALPRLVYEQPTEVPDGILVLLSPLKAILEMVFSSRTIRTVEALSMHGVPSKTVPIAMAGLDTVKEVRTAVLVHEKGTLVMTSYD